MSTKHEGKSSTEEQYEKQIWSLFHWPLYPPVQFDWHRQRIWEKCVTLTKYFCTHWLNEIYRKSSPLEKVSVSVTESVSLILTLNIAIIPTLAITLMLTTCHGEKSNETIKKSSSKLKLGNNILFGIIVVDIDCLKLNLLNYYLD
jgi:hypothetical protein